MEELLLAYWPAGVIVLPVIGAIWVGFKKYAKYSKTEVDDEIVEAVEKDPIGKRVSAYFQDKSPLK